MSERATGIPPAWTCGFVYLSTWDFKVYGNPNLRYTLIANIPRVVDSLPLSMG